MAAQDVKDQINSKIQLTAEIDSVIKAMCEKVREDDLVLREGADVAKALAQLVMARALL